MQRASFLLFIITGAIVGGGIGGYVGLSCFYFFIICSPIGGAVGAVWGGSIAAGIHALIIPTRFRDNLVDPCSSWGCFGLVCLGAGSGLAIAFISFWIVNL